MQDIFVAKNVTFELNVKFPIDSALSDKPKLII